MSRIAMVTSGLGVGGSELQFMQLAFGLRERGWEVSVVSLQPGGAFRSRFAERGISVADSQTGRVASPGQLVTLVKRLRSLRVDIIHTQAFRANLWGRLAAIFLGKPVIASVRATYSYVPRAYYPIERLLASKSDSIVTPSSATTKYLVAVVGIPVEKVVTIHNGVDSGLFSPQSDRTRFRNAWNARDSFVVLVAGRLTEQKNPLAALEAFARFRLSHPDALLVIAGAGPLERAVQSRASGLGDRVVLAGELSRVALAEAMAAADSVLLMSEFEGMPNVLLEAMASCRPIVATNVDGVRELIDSGVTGFLVSRSDIDAAAHYLGVLASSSALRARMGAAGRKRVELSYSVAANVAQHVKLYERALQPKSGLSLEDRPLKPCQEEFHEQN